MKQFDFTKIYGNIVKKELIIYDFNIVLLGVTNQEIKGPWSG